MPASVPTQEEFDALRAQVAEDVAALSGRLDALATQLAEDTARLTALHEALELAHNNLSASTGEAITRLDSAVAGLDVEQDAQDAAIAKLRRRVKALEDGLAPTEPTEPEAPVETMAVGTSLHRESGETFRDAWDRRVRNWGVEPEVVRYFFDTLPTTWPVFGNADVVVSFKVPSVNKVPDLAGLRDGKYDDALVNFFNSAPRNGRKQRWAFWHEREDDIEAGKFTEALYRAALAHLLELAASTGRTDLSAGTILMGWTANPASGRNTSKFLDAALPVEWVGWDVYPGTDRSGVRYKLQVCVDATKAAGKDTWLVCETGLNNLAPETVAAWIPDAFDIARELGFKQLMYFDSTVGGDFRLTEPIEWAAIAEEIRK